MLIKSLGYLLYGNLVLALCLYFMLRRSKRKMDELFGLSSATIIGGFCALLSGVILIYQFPFHYVFVTIVTTMIGMFIGALFGTLSNTHVSVTGYANGLMMGVMAPMIGAAAKNDSAFLIFLELLFLCSLFFIFRSSVRT